MDCQKNIAKLQRIKSAQLEIKPIKCGRKPGIMYCLGCKDYTFNFQPQEIKITNKVHGEKSICVFCRSSKPRFLKQKHSNKK